MSHAFKTEGSDCKPYRMVAMCSCGWQGPVIDGQGARSQELAKTQWSAHKTTDSISSADDFLQGQRDCQEGVPHKAGHSKDYDRGYMTEYEREQVLSELSRRKYGRS